MSEPDSRADADETGTPPPKGRPRQLDTLDRVRRELSNIYHQAKNGQMQMDRAKGLTYLLSQIAGVLKAQTTVTDDQLMALIAQLKERLK